jgi:tmRNA-binding protein
MTIVPLRLYFNAKGRAKIAIALGRGAARQEAARQTRQRKSARLEPPQVEVDARSGIETRRLRHIR